MKKIILGIILIFSFLVTGCTATLRQVKHTEVERHAEEIEVKVISTAQLQENSVLGIYSEAGIQIEIKNISKEMVILNLNNSSMTLLGSNGEYTSRIISGNDRIKNINSSVPNMVIPPNGTSKLTLYPADLLSPAHNGYGQLIGFRVDPAFKTFDKVRLAISYHFETGKEINLGKSKYFIASYSL